MGCGEEVARHQLRAQGDGGRESLCMGISLTGLGQLFGAVMAPALEKQLSLTGNWAPSYSQFGNWAAPAPLSLPGLV